MLRTLTVFILLTPGLIWAQQPDHQPAYLLQVPPSVPAIFIAETNAATLHRFSSAANDSFSRDERYMSIGQNGVGKQRPWDRRTPLGIYFVNETLDTSKLHEKYGPLAFALDYPNIWDRANKRGGDGIWIHGVTPNGGRRPPLDTDGCIALPNNELLALRDQFVPLVTPVIVTRSIDWQSAEKIAATRDELAAALDSWVASFRDGNLHQLLSLYAAGFSYRGMTRAEWSSFRAQSMRAVTIRNFDTSDILLLEDPDERGLYLSRFRQTIDYGDRTIATTKRLYWRRNDEGKLRIVAEDSA